MKNVQISFSLKSGLTIEMVQEKLKKVKEALDFEFGKGSYTVYSGHLSREILKEKGWSEEVPDAFESVFDKNYSCMTSLYNTFNEAMSNMSTIRANMAEECNVIITLVPDRETNATYDEITLFSEGKVRFA